ncbi:MAG: SAM-dependent methyltransferase [Ruminococcaceae bacterium]|nr:SAM-dependent methyltransferase [Oscillospiraceae bacterium]
MMEANAHLQSAAQLITLAARASLLKKAVLSRHTEGDAIKTTLTVRSIGGRPCLQAESLHKDNKAKHKNLEIGDADALLALLSTAGQINILTTLGESEYRTSKSGKTALLGGEALLKRLQGASPAAPTVATLFNNREKQYILSGNEPFLIKLEVSDKNGRVHDKKRAKFRQINRFLELVRDVEDKLPATGTLRICDLCCGKSYLSFAVYHYFAVIKQRQVRMTGVDLKQDVIDFCSATARDLGFDGLEFLCGDVGKYDTDDHVNLVISLHACDIATDLVLSRALAWEADVILSTPCCHHAMSPSLACPSLDFIAKHSMLRQKLCDAATDALRLKILEAHGYTTAALELIDPEETPKNVLLRGVRKKHPDPAACASARAEAEQIKCFLLGDQSPWWADVNAYKKGQNS